MSNEETRDRLKSEGLPCFLATEIPNLRGVSEDMLRMIYKTKQIFEKSQVVNPDFLKSEKE